MTLYNVRTTPSFGVGSVVVVSQNNDCRGAASDGLQQCVFKIVCAARIVCVCYNILRSIIDETDGGRYKLPYFFDVFREQ